MAENDVNFDVRKVNSAQDYINEKYSDTIGLATSILGQVLLGTIKGSKRKKEVIKLCLKDMKKQFADRVAENPLMEIDFMRNICNVGHPNFVSYIDAVEDSKLYCICLEYIKGGDMCTYIQNLRSGIGNERAKKYTIQLVKAVYFMHLRGYCHLDISLENLLWDRINDNILLCDFGLSRKFIDNDPSILFNSPSIRPGKKGYMAPEIYSYQKFNGESADCFSIGVLIFILLTGFPPFNTPTASDKCFKYIYFGKLEWLIKQWKLTNIISHQCADLLTNIFCHPKKRYKIKDILLHPWLNQDINQINQEINDYYTINPSINNINDKKEQSVSVSPPPPSAPPAPVPPQSQSQSQSSIPKTKRKSIVIKKKRLSRSKKSMDKKDKKSKKKVSTRSKSIPHILLSSATLLSEFKAVVVVDNDDDNKYDNNNNDIDNNDNNYNNNKSSLLSSSTSLRARSKSFSYYYSFKKDVINNKKQRQNSQKKTKTKTNSISAIKEDTPTSQSTSSSSDDYKSIQLQTREERNKSVQSNIANLRDKQKDNKLNNKVKTKNIKTNNDNSNASPIISSSVNDTKLLAKRFANINVNNNDKIPNNSMNDYDRKEGDYNTTERNSVHEIGVAPSDDHEDRRLSLNDDAHSQHSNHHSQHSQHSHHSHHSVHTKHSSQHSQHSIQDINDDDDNNNNINNNSIANSLPQPNQHPYIVDDVNSSDNNIDDATLSAPTNTNTNILHSPKRTQQ